MQIVCRYFSLGQNENCHALQCCSLGMLSLWLEHSTYVTQAIHNMIAFPVVLGGLLHCEKAKWEQNWCFCALALGWIHRTSSYERMLCALFTIPFFGAKQKLQYLFCNRIREGSDFWRYEKERLKLYINEAQKHVRNSMLFPPGGKSFLNRNLIGNEEYLFSIIP